MHVDMWYALFLLSSIKAIVTMHRRASCSCPLLYIAKFWCRILSPKRVWQGLKPCDRITRSFLPWTQSRSTWQFGERLFILASSFWFDSLKARCCLLGSLRRQSVASALGSWSLEDSASGRWHNLASSKKLAVYTVHTIRGPVSLPNFEESAQAWWQDSGRP